MTGVLILAVRRRWQRGCLRGRSMKILPLTPRSTQGHVLAMVLVVVTICAIALTSYLNLVNAQNRVVARSQGWNAAVPVMEAGIEEALAHLSANIEHGLDTDGWVHLGGIPGYYRMERAVGDSYYVVTITVPPTNVNYPIVESRGFNRTPLLVRQNQAPFFLAVGGTSYNVPRQGYRGRGVRITTKYNGSLTKAILSDATITLGGDVMIDSYNSCDPAKNTDGRYDPAKAGDNGSIASNGELVSAGGSVRIKGHVSTGPGGTVGVAGSASIGDDEWVDSGRTGIQDGYFRDDMNFNIADSPTPPTGGFTSLLPGIGEYTWVLTTGTYIIDGSFTMNSSQKMLIAGDVKLYFTGDFRMSSSSAIVIAETTGRLEMYVGGSTTTIAGQGIVNTSGDTSRFTYYGLETNTKVNFSGGADFYGVIYAPNAEFSPAGGSIVNGAVVAKSVKTTGAFTVHYDECLAKKGKPRFIVLSWDELYPEEVARVP